MTHVERTPDGNGHLLAIKTKRIMVVRSSKQLKELVFSHKLKNFQYRKTMEVATPLEQWFYESIKKELS